MRTFILAAAAVLALGTGAAYAGDGDGPTADTQFTLLPGVVVQAQVPQSNNSAVAQGKTPGAPTAAFVTNSHSGTWLFQPDMNGGANS